MGGDFDSGGQEFGLLFPGHRDLNLEGPCIGLNAICHHLERLYQFFSQGATHFHFALGPMSYVASPAARSILKGSRVVQRTRKKEQSGLFVTSVAWGMGRSGG